MSLISTTRNAISARARRLALAAAGAACFALPRLGAQVWDGGAATGVWATAANWSPNGVPVTRANLTFDAANANGQFDITLQNTSRTVGSITFISAGTGNGFTFTAGTATLTVRGGITNNDGATQRFNAPVVASVAQTWNAAAGGLAFTDVTLSSNLTLAGSADISAIGPLTNSGGNRSITNNSSGAVTLATINLSNSNTARTLTISGSGSTGVNGIIANGGTGAGRLTKTGAGTLTLAGVNTYTGATTISGGTLRLGADNALSDRTAVTVAAGANFNINNYVDTVGSLAGAGVVTLGSGTLTVGASNASTTFSGSFAAGDTGTFAKTGTGTLTLGAGMNLASGTLVLDGGTLSLGVFRSTVGALAVTADSILDFGTGGGSILDILNSVTVDPTATLTIRNWTDTVDDFYSLIDPGAANRGRIIFSPGYAGTDTKWLPYDHQITPVPEPSAYGAALLGLTAFVGCWRLRRRRSTS